MKERRRNFGDGAGEELGGHLQTENRAARAERRRRPKLARQERETTFGLEQPNAHKVYVCDFNDWSPHSLPMLRRRENGRWEKRLISAAGRYCYKFIVDGRWVHSPRRQVNVSNGVWHLEFGAGGQDMTEKECVPEYPGPWMKRLCSLAGSFVLMVSAAWAGVGPGVASELPVTSPLMGNGGSLPQLTFPSSHVVPSPVYTAAPRQQPGPAQLHVVSPLPGSSPAPVAVTVGPAIPSQRYTHAPVHVVSPLAGSSPAPVAVTAGPTVTSQRYPPAAVHVLSPSPGTSPAPVTVTLRPTIALQHGLRGAAQH